MHVFRVWERPLEHGEPLHVGGGLVAEARLPTGLRVGAVDGTDGIRKPRSLAEATCHVVAGDTPVANSGEPRDVVEKSLSIRALTVAVPQLRNEVRLVRDRELRVRIEHLLQQGRAAARDPQDDDWGAATFDHRPPRPAR